jgi:outer membrane murein-binding lipoprotein Lpp
VIGIFHPLCELQTMVIFQHDLSEKELTMLRFTRSYILAGLVFAVLVLAGCQQVADTRTEICQTLRDVGTAAAELKSAKIDQPVDQIKTTASNLQQKRQNLDRLARLTSIPSLVKLDSAVDSAVQAVNEAVGGTVGSAVTKINAAGDQLQQAYTELNNAVCAAK